MRCAALPLAPSRTFYLAPRSLSLQTHLYPRPTTALPWLPWLPWLSLSRLVVLPQYKSVQNCTEALLKSMIALENINNNNASVGDGPVDLFDSWAMYLGDLGDFQECAVGGNLYCAVETNFSQEVNSIYSRAHNSPPPVCPP